MIANVGKHTQRWIHKGSLSGATIKARGNGITPTFPITEHGAVKKALFDVEVPATLAGAQADWNGPYPGQYAVGSFNLGLLVYDSPIDTGANLNGKGNVLLVGAHVLGGVGITGAAPPAQIGGTCPMSIKVFGTALNGWTRTAQFPVALAGVLYPSATTELVFGTDSGLGNNLVLNIAPAANDLTAGRIRIVLLFVEV